MSQFPSLTNTPSPRTRMCRGLRSPPWLALSLLAAFLAHVSIATPLGADPANRPNVLLILTDDQGYGDVSIHGNKWIQTPNVDRIAAEGARFDRFFVEPVCAPTRAAILSGRYPTRTGVFGVTRNREVMRDEEVTLAELLRDRAGYSTGCFGKWHNGAHWPHHPNAQGFDEFVGFCAGHWNEYYDAELQHNGNPIQTRGFIADVLTDYAIEFMQSHSRNGESPFFCYVPLNTPHTPASVPVEEWERWHDRNDVEDTFTRAMYALCENLDQNVGRLLRALDDLNLADETIVLFLTDNGPNGSRFNAEMRGQKGSEHEGGIRVPLFVRWPGKIKPGTVIQRNAAHIDLLPTLCAIAGIQDPQSHTLPLDGIDLSPLLLGHPPVNPKDRYLYTWRNPKRWSIRSSQYRATATTLHDLSNDPAQKTDLSRERPELHRELVSEYKAWAEGAVPTSPQPQRVHIGYNHWPRVSISAHELEVRPEMGQGIDYSGPQGFANQWITRWSDAGAYAECPLRVVQSGRYRVAIRYACDPGEVGSQFTLRVGKSVVEFTLTEPWISAPRPAPEVYRKRHNSYLSRDWKEMQIGEFSLAEGDYVMELRATEKPGPMMPDVKAIVFEIAGAP